MKRLAGQAGRTIGYFFHHAGMLLITAFFVFMLAFGGLAYRLSLGPLQIPWLTSRLANAVSGQDIEIHVGQAALAWAGFKNGGGQPLYLRLGEISVRNAGGITLATVPEARLVFSPGAFFSSQAPIYVSSSDARFVGSNVPVSLLAGIRLGTAFTLSRASLWVTLGAGQLGPAGFAEPLAGGKFLLNVTPEDVQLTEGQFTLTPEGKSTPVIQISGAAHRDNTDSAWHGSITLGGNAVQAEDLPNYWPTQLVPLTRSWVTANIVAGTAHDPSFTFGLSAPRHLSTMTIDSATGSFKVDDATLTWITGAQPITGLSGVFMLTDADDIEITADIGHLGGVALAAAHMHIAGVSHHDQVGTLNIPVSGSLQDTLAVLNGPRLELLKAVPATVQAATGDMTGSVGVVLPFKKNLTINDVGLTVDTALKNVTMPLPVKGLSFTQGSLSVDATTQSLQVTGNAMLAGQSASITASANFGPVKGPGAATLRFDMKTNATGATLSGFGLNPGAGVQGSMPVTVHVVTTPSNSGSLTLNADLTRAALSLPVFGWTKPAGAPGKFSFAATINGDNFSGISRIDSIDAKAPGLDIETHAAGGGLNLTRIRIGNTDGAGRIVPPANATSPWSIDVFGNMLDVSSELNPTSKSSAATNKPLTSKITKPQPPSGFLWDATAHFDNLVLAPKPEPVLNDFNFDGNGRGNSVFNGSATATMGSGQTVDLAMSPVAGTEPGNAESLKLQTTDGGSFLQALGIYDHLQGGKLDLDATYGVTAPLTGKVTMTKFRLLNAPAFGKILQAITVLGIPEATSGPGLQFNELVGPFSIDNQVMTLKGARAYSSALGFTTSGTIDLDTGTCDLHGTIVPAYALNALPGKIPLIGKLFSPEKGGGLFAMRYSMTGPIADPKVTANPLSALTPGFLREIFGLGSK